MIITIDPHAGLCMGVRRAIQMAEAKLEHESSLAVLGQLIHNQRELERLRQKGLAFLDQKTLDAILTPETSIDYRCILIRSHGISQALSKRLEATGVSLIDATCPLVRRIQLLARTAYEHGDQVIIVGKKSHPEVQGILGYCEPAGRVVESSADLAQIDLKRPATLIAQSTVARDFFLEIAGKLKGQMLRLRVKDTTCSFMNRRFQQVQYFSRHQDLMFIVGGKNSSNTGLIFVSARRVNKATYLIEGAEELENICLRGVDRIGISGGASTPYWQLAAVKEFLEYKTRKGKK